MTRAEMRTVALLLLLPLAIAIAAWIFDVALLTRANDTDLEGDYYLTSFFGALCFIGTGPLAGAVLSRSVNSRKMRLPVFLGLLFLVSLPILSFQVLAYSSSILDLFVVGNPWTIGNMRWFYVQTAVLGAAVYLAYGLIIYTQAEYGVVRAWITAVLLSAASLAIIIFRILHS